MTGSPETGSCSPGSRTACQFCPASCEVKAQTCDSAQPGAVVWFSCAATTMKLGLSLLWATEGSLAPKPQPFELSACTELVNRSGNRGARPGAWEPVGGGTPSGFSRLAAGLGGDVVVASPFLLGVGTGGRRSGAWAADLLGLPHSPVEA